MTGVASAFVVGAIAGAAFALMGLPIPAPPTLAGLAGIAGLTAAYLTVNGVR